jgi:hypothetical protein
MDNPQFNAIRLIWAGLVMGVVAATGVMALVASTGGEPPMPGSAPTLLAAMAGVVGVVASRLLPRRLVKARGSDVGAVYRVRFILAAMMCEFPAIVGAIAHMLSHRADALIVGVVPFAALLALFPRSSALEAVEAEAAGG